MTPLETLALFVERLTLADVPDAVVNGAKECVLDTLGVSLAAVGDESGVSALQVCREWGGDGRGAASLIGEAAMAPAAQAAFVNGVLAHSLDFDDTHLPSVLHPSASIVPAVLAVGEATGARGEDALAAAIAGYEVCIRAGLAGYSEERRASLFFERGWHATSICGALGCAAAAAKLYGLPAKRVGDAVAIACSLSSGIIESNRGGGSVKQIHCGWAAHAGVSAAHAAMYGISGPPTALEGRFGFCQAYCGDEADVDAFCNALGERWTVPQIRFKPYPANLFTHTAIDAAVVARARVDVEAIVSLEIGVAGPTLRTIAEPRADKVRPRNPYHALFSAPFVVATVLLKDDDGEPLTFGDIDEVGLRDERRIALAEKIYCVADPECDRLFPDEMPAILRVRTRDGHVETIRRMENQGGPRDANARPAMLRKFRANAARALAPDAAAAMEASVLGLEATSCGDVMALAREARPRTAT